jgi:putative DNA primase/helicase
VPSVSAHQHHAEGDAQFVRALAPVAKKLWGAPNEQLSTADQWRWGTRGSRVVDPARGVWHDFETGEGGGTLDLVRRERKTDKDGALDFLAECGHIEKRIDATYDYVDERGALLFQVVRRVPKKFVQRRPDGFGGWVWATKGIRKVLYRLPQLIEAVKAQRTIFIAEGEKAVQALEGIGHAATCSPGGAGKWRPEYSNKSVFRDAEVVLLPDNDDAGRAHVEKVALTLRGVAARVRVLALPRLPEKGDVFDWIAAGGTGAELARLAQETTEARPARSPATDVPAASASPSDLTDFDLTEDGIALAFASKHGGELRFDHTIGGWYRWNGAIWQREQTKLAFAWARHVCREIAHQNQGDGASKGTLAKAATAAAVERFAQSDRVFAVTAAIWDTNPLLLGTPGGTVDLKTGTLRSAQQQHLITKQTAVAPDPAPNCPLWLQFLNETTGRNAALIGFLRQWCGYSLTGDTREHALLFIYGPGGNGKSVFLNVISGILGDYCRQAAMETFTASASDKHPTDLAMLKGARMVCASETEEGRPWAEVRIKQLTGGDTITARFMRQDFFEFRPELKLIVIGNHKPVLRNVDEAARRRFNVVPFVNKPVTPDPGLEGKLRAEWPAILRWMIDGCLDWRKNGLLRPEIVLKATAEYFSEQDTVRQWVDEQCEVGPSHAGTLESLFRNWTAYALSNGEKPGTTRWFSQTLARLGYEAVKHTPGANERRGFAGLMVKPPPPEPSPYGYGDQ